MLINEFVFPDLIIGDSINFNSGRIKFYKNKITILRGPNGCGKSSILYEMANLRPNYIKGKQSHWAFTWSKIGLVQQKYEDSLFPWLSVENNANFYSPINTHCELISDFSKTHDRVHKLSGGMKQRLSIVKELGIGRQNLILLDEPFSSQHPAFKKIILKILLEYVYDGGSILLVSHDDTVIDQSFVFVQRCEALDSHSKLIKYEIT